MIHRSIVYIIQERTTLLPLSMRLLYMVLYTEIRLFTRSVKQYVLYFLLLKSKIDKSCSPTWLPSSISWLLQSCVGAVVGEDGPLIVDEVVISDVTRVLDQVKDIYASAEDSLRVSRQVGFTIIFFRSILKRITATKHNDPVFQCQHHSWGRY
jgi:hypothetical protein